MSEEAKRYFEAFRILGEVFGWRYISPVSSEERIICALRHATGVTIKMMLHSGELRWTDKVQAADKWKRFWRASFYGNGRLFRYTTSSQHELAELILRLMDADLLDYAFLPES